MDPETLQMTLNYTVKDVLLLIFYLLVGFYAIFSAILFFHWQAYSMDAKVSGLTLIIYFATSIPLIIIMGIMILII